MLAAIYSWVSCAATSHEVTAGVPVYSAGFIFDLAESHGTKYLLKNTRKCYEISKSVQEMDVSKI